MSTWYSSWPVRLPRGTSYPVLPRTRERQGVESGVKQLEQDNNACLWASITLCSKRSALEGPVYHVCRYQTTTVVVHEWAFMAGPLTLTSSHIEKKFLRDDVDSRDVVLYTS